MDVQALSPGNVIDRYTVEAFIGSGGMATVVKVRHRQLGTTHALKVLSVASGPVRDRLVQEGRLQATLQHENVVKVTDLVTLANGSPGLIMEFVEGPNLDELLTERPPNLAQADHLAQGILRGVEEAHRHGLVHRDLKPANILLQPGHRTWVPKVADFGIAKVLAGDGNHSGHTRTGMTMGTPNYMAPEQARDAKNIGPTADIFALGAILYELLTHQRAFEGNDLLDTLNAVAQARYTPILERAPDAPRAMVQAIEAALQVDPSDRPQTVDELRLLWLGDRAPLTSPVVFDDVRPRTLPPMPVPTHTTLGQSRAAEGSASLHVTDPPVRTPGPGGSRIGVVALVAGLVFGLVVSAGFAAAVIAFGLGPFDRAPRTEPEAPGTPPTTASAGPEAEPAPAVDDDRPDGVDVAGPDPGGAVGLTADEPVVPMPIAADGPPVDPPTPASAEAPPTDEPPAHEAPPDEPPGDESPVDEPPMEEPPTEEPPTEALPRDELPGDEAPTTDPAPVVTIAPVPAPAPDGLDAVVEAVAAIEAKPAPPPVPKPEPGPPPLEGYLADVDPAVRKRGIKNLDYRTDRASRVLLGRMMRDDNDPSVRSFAWDTVADLIGKGDEHMDVLLDHAGWQLAHGEHNHAVQAAKLLRSRGSRPGLLAPGLQRDVSDIQLATLDAVEDLPPEDRITLRSEVERLRHSSSDRLRKRAESVLESMQ